MGYRDIYRSLACMLLRSSHNIRLAMLGISAQPILLDSATSILQLSPLVHFLKPHPYFDQRKLAAMQLLNFLVWPQTLNMQDTLLGSSETWKLFIQIFGSYFLFIIIVFKISTRVIIPSFIWAQLILQIIRIYILVIWNIKSHEIAKSRRGKCLSSEYLDNLQSQCGNIVKGTLGLQL